MISFNNGLHLMPSLPHSTSFEGCDFESFQLLIFTLFAILVGWKTLTTLSELTQCQPRHFCRHVHTWISMTAQHFLNNPPTLRYSSHSPPFISSFHKKPKPILLSLHPLSHFAFSFFRSLVLGHRLQKRKEKVCSFFHQLQRKLVIRKVVCLDRSCWFLGDLMNSCTSFSFSLVFHRFWFLYR